MQLFGDSPVLMAKGAKILEDRGVSHININMGCPVKKVWKACAGAQLMSDLPRATEMMRTIRKAVKIPVSVKTRIGVNDSEITAFKMRDIATEEGMEFFCVHGRTRTQMYAGKADWNLIENLAKESKIPIIGNGDIFDEEMAIKRLKISNLKGIMLARGILGKPWLAASVQNIQNGKDPIRLTQKEMYETIIKHLARTLELYGISSGIKIFRKHLGWYSKGLKNGAIFRLEINQIEDEKILRQKIKDFFLENGAK
ncbi:MAG: tRNA dihydrouridine synthase [Alphaproteobacteria bacterium]